MGAEQEFEVAWRGADGLLDQMPDPEPIDGSPTRVAVDWHELAKHAPDVDDERSMPAPRRPEGSGPARPGDGQAWIPAPADVGRGKAARRLKRDIANRLVLACSSCCLTSKAITPASAPGPRSSPERLPEALSAPGRRGAPKPLDAATAAERRCERRDLVRDPGRSDRAARARPRGLNVWPAGCRLERRRRSGFAGTGG